MRGAESGVVGADRRAGGRKLYTIPVRDGRRNRL